MKKTSKKWWKKWPKNDEKSMILEVGGYPPPVFENAKNRDFRKVPPGPKTGAGYPFRLGHFWGPFLVTFRKNVFEKSSKNRRRKSCGQGRPFGVHFPFFNIKYPNFDHFLGSILAPFSCPFFRWIFDRFLIDFWWFFWCKKTIFTLGFR